MNETRCPLCGGSVAYGTQEDQGTSHCMKCGFWFVTDTEDDITDAIESARKEALAKLAALEKRIADAPRRTNLDGTQTAMLRLTEDDK